MHRDTVIGIVGVVILVAAMVGVFTYERGQAANLSTAGGGAMKNVTGPSATGTVNVGATADSTVTINQTGLKNVTFTLTWKPGTGTDTLKLSAAPSAGTGLTTGFESQPDSSGTVTLAVPLNNTAADGKIGVGAWKLTVTFVSASPGTPVGPLPVTPPANPPQTTDSSVSYSIASALQALS